MPVFLSTTDAYWGIEWVGESHEALYNALLALILLHIAGVAFSSWRHHENLIKAMVSGRKQVIPSVSGNQGDANASNQRSRKCR